MRRVDLEHLLRAARDSLIEGSIGELSNFHETHGYYAHAVGPETPLAPVGWQERLIPVSNANTKGATGWCVEMHDLVLAKCVAGRDKDWRFADEAVAAGLVELRTLLERAADVPVSPERRQGLADHLRARYAHDMP